MELKHCRIKISKIEGNKGQIEGVPDNPRLWASDEVEKLADSIRETPELLQARPLIVVPNGKKYVVLGGNMRLAALKKINEKETECIVMEGLTSEQMKAIVIKDNASFGEWNIDDLNTEWDTSVLDAWGVHVDLESTTEEYEPSNSEIDTTSFEEDMTMRFKLTDEQMAYIQKELGGNDARVEILKRLNYQEGLA